MPPGVYHPETCRLAAAMNVKIQRDAKLQWERQWAADSTTTAPTRRLIKTPSKLTRHIQRTAQSMDLSHGADEDWSHWFKWVSSLDRDLR